MTPASIKQQGAVQANIKDRPDAGSGRAFDDTDPDAFGALLADVGDVSATPTSQGALANPTLRARGPRMGHEVVPSTTGLDLKTPFVWALLSPSADDTPSSNAKDADLSEADDAQSSSVQDVSGGFLNMAKAIAAVASTVVPSSLPPGMSAPSSDPSRSTPNTTKSVNDRAVLPNGVAGTPLTPSNVTTASLNSPEAAHGNADSKLPKPSDTFEPNLEERVKIGSHLPAAESAADAITPPVGISAVVVRSYISAADRVRATNVGSPEASDIMSPGNLEIGADPSGASEAARFVVPETLEAFPDHTLESGKTEQKGFGVSDPEASAKPIHSSATLSDEPARVAVTSEGERSEVVPDTDLKGEASVITNVSDGSAGNPRKDARTILAASGGIHTAGPIVDSAASQLVGRSDTSDIMPSNGRDESTDTGAHKPSLSDHARPGEPAPDHIELVMSADAIPTSAVDPGIAVVVVPASSTPVQAVARSITTLTDRQAHASNTEAIATSTLAPPRTLTLQLTPANMGTISVTMHAVGHALDLRLAVSEKDTLGAISRDREALSKAILDQGYDLKSLIIQGHDTSPAASSSDNRESRADQADGQSQPGSDRQSSRSGAGHGDQRPKQNVRTPTDENTRVAARSRAGDLFV